MTPGWLKISDAKEYVSISDKRTIKKWFDRGLRHVRLESGLILIKRQWIDDFLEAREVNQKNVDELVNDICRDLKN